MKATILWRLQEVQQETELSFLGATRSEQQKRETAKSGGCFLWSISECRWLRNRDFKSPDKKLACDKASVHGLWLEISQKQRSSCNPFLSYSVCCLWLVKACKEVLFHGKPFLPEPMQNWIIVAVNLHPRIFFSWFLEKVEGRQVAGGGGGRKRTIGCFPWYLPLVGHRSHNPSVHGLMP